MKKLLALCVALIGIGGNVMAGSPQPTVAERVIAPHSTDVWTVQFYGNEEAAVLLIGDASSDLDLYIYDEFGNLIASTGQYDFARRGPDSPSNYGILATWLGISIPLTRLHSHAVNLGIPPPWRGAKP